MRIAYFCQYFVPETAAPAARLSELSRAWTAAGHHVTVVTGLPNHPTGIVPPEYRGVLFRRERLGEVDVWRNWLYATPNEGLVRKTLSHLSFMFSTLLFSVPRLRGHQVLIVSSPSFFVAITVCIASWIWRVPYIFEVRDLWPGVFIELGILKNRLIIRVLEGIEMFLYRRAAKVVVVTDSFRDVLIARGLPPDAVAVVTNGVDTEAFKPSPEAAAGLRAQHGFGDAFVVLYIGAHGISQGLTAILDAAGRLARDETIKFVFVGDGADKQKLIDRARERRLSNVTFLPSQERQTVAGWYSLAGAVLVPLRDIPMFDTFIPSKMFEVMACERPIVASVRGEARRILERSRGALIVDPEDAGAIAASIERLRAEPELGAALGCAGRAFAVASYDRSALAATYLALIEPVRTP